MSLLRRLAAMCAAYAVALQVIVAGFTAPQLDFAYPDALMVICAGSNDQPVPVDRHHKCVLCVMPGGCAGHALLDTGGVGAVAPLLTGSVAAAPVALTQGPAVARTERSHAARAPPIA